jgi:hypothetical protein
MLQSGRAAQAVGGSREDDSEVGAFEVGAARADARRAASVAVAPPGLTSSFGVARGFSPADWSYAVPMFLQPHFATQSPNDLLVADLVGSGGSFPVQERGLYVQSLMNGPSLSAGAMGGSWLATGTPDVASSLDAPTVGSLLQTTQMYLLQRRLQEHRMRSLPLHSMQNPYGMLRGVAASYQALNPLPGTVASASSVTAGSESIRRPATMTETRSLPCMSSASDEQHRSAEQSSNRGDGSASFHRSDRRQASASGADALAPAAFDAAAKSPAASPKLSKKETQEPLVR